MNAAGALRAALLAQNGYAQADGFIYMGSRGDVDPMKMADDLKDAGYVVVQLPKPDSERYTGDEHEPADRPSWEVDTYEVAVWHPGEVQVNYDGTEGEPLDIAVARDFAGALLAAIERAES